VSAPAESGDATAIGSLTPRMRADDRATGIGLMTGSALSVQIGSALASQAFPVLGPAGVVAIRQWVASVLMLASTRPKVRAFTRKQWQPVIALAVTYAVMNISLYTAIDRIGLGLAVTIEFLGPLALALLASRGAIDLGCAIVAGAAAITLGRPQPSTDYVGIAIGALAAAGWAAYILTARVIGKRFTDSQGQAVAITLSALLYTPLGLWMMASRPMTATAVIRAAAAGLLCTAVPLICDVKAMRRVPAQFYGVFMSVNPLLAAIIGLVVLGQQLSAVDWLCVGLIVTANAVSIITRHEHDDPLPATE
jgi:inner membrane transporter RhtA